MIRTVELTDHSVVIDGRDVSNLVTGAQLTISAHDAWPVLDLTMLPDVVLYYGRAEVPGTRHVEARAYGTQPHGSGDVPLDGIERLRQRLGCR